MREVYDSSMPLSEEPAEQPKTTTDKPKTRRPETSDTAIGRGKGAGDTSPNIKVNVETLAEAAKHAANTAATPPPAPTKAVPPADSAKAAVEKKPEVPWVPLVQVDPAVEREILGLIQLCESAHARTRERKARIAGEPLQPETTKHWSTTLLGLLKRLDEQVRKLPPQSKAAETATSLRAGIRGLYDRLRTGDAMQPEVNTKSPTVASAVIYELTAHRSLNQKVVPQPLQDAADYLTDAMANGRSIGDGPYGRVPSPKAAAFAAAALAHKPVEKEQVGVVNKFVPWSELAQRMQTGANRIVQEGAYNQVLERAESDVKRAPSAQEPDAVRTKYDQDMLDAIQLAEQSDFHRETPAAQRRAIQGRLDNAKAALAKRGLAQPKAAEDPKKKT